MKIRSKSTGQILRSIAVILAVAFVFAIVSCGDGAESGGSIKSVTYKGFKDGVTYTLKITENKSRAYLPQADDTYNLRFGAKESSGTVTEFDSGTITLKPDNSTETFSAWVSGTSLLTLTGKITYTDETSETGTIVLMAGNLSYSGKTLPAGKVGTVYSQNLASAKGATGITYAVAGGSTLPSGLGLSSAGMLTGTPDDTVTNATFSVTASATGYTSATATFTLTINPATSGGGGGGGALTLTLTGVGSLVGKFIDLQITSPSSNYDFAISNGTMQASAQAFAESGTITMPLLDPKTDKGWVVPNSTNTYYIYLFVADIETFDGSWYKKETVRFTSNNVQLDLSEFSLQDCPTTSGSLTITFPSSTMSI